MKPGAEDDGDTNVTPDLGTATRADGPSPLERRYRWLLRVLPAGYRAVREQEMVDAFVQGCIEANPELADLTVQTAWPGLRESASVVGLALRLRWADPQAPRRYQVRAAGLRVATLAALAVLSVTAAQGVLSQVWFAVAPPRGTVDASPAQILFGTDPDLWSLVQSWAFALWIPALILTVMGGRRGAGWAAVAAAVPTVTMVITAASRPAGSEVDLGAVVLAAVHVATIGGLVAIASARTGAGIRRRWQWLAAAALGFLALAVVGLVARFVSPAVPSALGYLLVDTAGIWCAAAVMAAVVLVVRRRHTRPSTATLLGLTGLAGAATVLRASMLPLWLQYAHQESPQSVPIVTSIIAQLVVAAAITLVAGTLAIMRIRRLPPVSYLPTGAPVTG